MTEALRQAVSLLGQTAVDDTVKGVPLGASIRLSEFGAQGWNVARGDLGLPVTTLTESALAANLATMRDYCERHGVRLAPHGKTTMSPQLFLRQLEHGAWALTAATPTQVAVMRRHGLRRIILANEMADRKALEWIAAEQDADAELEFFCLVDGVEAVETMDAVLTRAGSRRPVQVLVEVGVPGGRCGVRDLEGALAVARAAHQSPRLALAGVEAYEGQVTEGGSPQDLATIEAFFATMREIATAILDDDLIDTPEMVVTAGGSAYFDLVVAGLSGISVPSRPPVALVLRSGCYLSHDTGNYARVSPLDGRAPLGEELRLVSALTAWASVLSRPEPGLAILGSGKRDVAHDEALPTPRTLHRTSGETTDLRGRAEVIRLMDQHAFVRIPTDLQIAAGDVVAMDMAHPCTAFDKVPLVPIIDDEHRVIDAVRTFF